MFWEKWKMTDKLKARNKKYIQQKLVITIESMPDDKINIKHTFTPPIDMKNDENNNRAIIECFVRFMDLLNKKDSPI
jgi:hypothetical protein